MINIKKYPIFLLLLGIIQTTYAMGFSSEIEDVAHRWAVIKYQYEPARQGTAYEELILQTDRLVEAYPYEAEPLIWSATVYISYAGTSGQLQKTESRRLLLEKARDNLHRAKNIDSRAVDGSALSLLGYLYFDTPGLLAGVNDAERALEYLQSGILLSKNGLDAHYYYGNFLVEQEKFIQAVNVLETALSSPPLPANPVADRGRRQEVRELLEYARKQASQLTGTS